ncbi:hypothetical protein M0R45_025725 [Rubus argutus]|uniref:Uncharacterized protein n=1 Tax=Rubus argutus TaxID=59490 RepID=A0AAW1WVG2_RUBAR
MAAALSCLSHGFTANLTFISQVPNHSKTFTITINQAAHCFINNINSTIAPLQFQSTIFKPSHYHLTEPARITTTPPQNPTLPCHHHCNLFLSTAASSSLSQSQSHNSQPKTAMSSLFTAPMPITSLCCCQFQPHLHRLKPSLLSRPSGVRLSCRSSKLASPIFSIAASLL